MIHCEEKKRGEERRGKIRNEGTVRSLFTKHEGRDNGDGGYCPAPTNAIGNGEGGCCPVRTWLGNLFGFAIRLGSVFYFHKQFVQKFAVVS